MAFLKHHWFGFILSAIVLIYLVVFLLVLVSPQQDAEGRGFVKCTNELRSEVTRCAGGKFCVLGAVVDSGFCNIGVVGSGVINWVKGNQKTPWANYLFAPEKITVSDGDEYAAGLADFYRENPNPAQGMENLKKANVELEDKVKDNGKENESPGMESE